MIENIDESSLEVGLSYMVSHASDSFAYVKLSVELLPTLTQLDLYETEIARINYIRNRDKF